MCSPGKVSIEWSDRCGTQPGLRKIGTLGEHLGRCRKVQKRVLGGEGLTRVGGDGFGSSLDAELRFAKLHFDDSCALRGQDHVRERSFESEVPEREFQSGATTSAPTMPRGLVLVSNT